MTATKYYNGMETESQTLNNSNYSKRKNKPSNGLDDQISNTYLDEKP